MKVDRNKIKLSSRIICWVFGLILGIGSGASGCKMVSVPKGPPRHVERVFGQESLGKEVVVDRQLSVSLVGVKKTGETKNSMEMRGGGERASLCKGTVLPLKVTVRERCGQRIREHYRVDEVQEFKVHGCMGAADLLCAILPATIITSIAGVPLGAYGIKKLRDAGEHDSNAVGMIAAGGWLVGLGLAGVISCPIARHMERKCRAMKRKVKRGKAQKRVVDAPPKDCGNKLVRESALMVSVGRDEEGGSKGSPKIQMKHPLKVHTTSLGALHLDVLELMAQNGLLISPPRLHLKLVEKDSHEGAFKPKAKAKAKAKAKPKAKPTDLKLPKGYRKRLVRATRRETLTLVEGEKRIYKRPLGGEVRYRVLKLLCRKEMAVSVSSRSAAQGRVWMETNKKTSKKAPKALKSLKPNATETIQCSPSLSPRLFLLAPQKEEGSLEVELIPHEMNAGENP